MFSSNKFPGLDAAEQELRTEEMSDGDGASAARTESFVRKLNQEEDSPDLIAEL